MRAYQQIGVNHLQVTYYLFLNRGAHHYCLSSKMDQRKRMETYRVSQAVSAIAAAMIGVSRKCTDP